MQSDGCSWRRKQPVSWGPGNISRGIGCLAGLEGWAGTGCAETGEGNSTGKCVYQMPPSDSGTVSESAWWEQRGHGGDGEGGRLG